MEAPKPESRIIEARSLFSTLPRRMSCWSLGPVVSSTQACTGFVHLDAVGCLSYRDSALCHLYLAHFGLEFGIALMSIAPVQVMLDLIGEFLVVSGMGSLEGKATQRAKMGFDSVHP